MVRVMVIGNAGGGKSTICGAICAAHDLPYHAINQMQWRPGWEPAPAEELEEDHRRLIGGERWLIDGYGPWSSVEARLAAADTIILVDHPIHIHFWWAAKRQVKSILFGRPDAPQGCRMWPVTFRLFAMIWRLHRDMRTTLVNAVYAREGDARIIHLRSPEELNAFARNPV